LNQNEIDNAASEIYNWVSNAVSDVAYSNIIEGNGMFFDTETNDWISKKKAEGITGFNLADCYADKIWNSPSDLQDLLGDQICDAAVMGRHGVPYDEQKVLMTKIAVSMLEKYGKSHKALVDALNGLIERWKPKEA
jgi:hypothetical protein